MPRMIGVLSSNSRAEKQRGSNALKEECHVVDVLAGDFDVLSTPDMLSDNCASVSGAVYLWVLRRRGYISMAQVSVKPGSVLIFNSGAKIVDWLRWADDDYIAARGLLLEDLLVQGAGLANTAIEKYFKTILLIKKHPATKVHDIPGLFQQLRKNGICLNLNHEYLDLLFKLYKLRDPDDLKPGFSVGIDRTRLLTELDFTVFEIRKGFNIVGPFGPIQSTVEELLARKDKRLIERNCYFGSADRSALFAEGSSRYAMRVLAPGFLVWAKYETLGVPDTPNFKVEYPVAISGNKMEARLPLE